MIHKIGIISDTHDLLRDEVIRSLQGCEYILHAGDCSNKQIIEELEKIAPVMVVCGNNDLTRSREWALTLPETADFQLYGLHIRMVHNKKILPKDLSPYDLVVYGHSHKYGDKITGNTRILNPGSCGPRRFRQEITMTIMTVDDSCTSDAEAHDNDRGRIINIEKIVIPNPAGNTGTASGKEAVGKEALKLQIEPKIPSIMKDLACGKSVKQIARKYKITEELSEQITRMYLTHPGVDADGILRRIGL